MAKMSKKWIVLCSAAIGAMYVSEYMITDTHATAAPPISISQTVSPSLNNPVPSAASQIYRDGTFTGMGSNRRGAIQVDVTLKNDKITDVQISQFAMHYSESDVVGLPDEVLQNQSAQVDNVSGATFSTRAFEEAVQNALDQARNS
ncbi:FMN-binding protein [Paenibacillus solisilvae]|uniref:FMN-binding protein n=1 Tax=Paenibacillus solisilvae TaxID=2486751 RepID=A0ABW0W5H1_9BACL